MSPPQQEDPDQRVRAAATRLYAGPPADFVATRTTLVKEARAAGAREAAKAITALRKPGVAAWLLNQLAHAHDRVLTDLADLGTRLRHAQSTLDATALGSLRGERDEALAALVAAAQQVAADHGQQLTAAVAAEVRDTAIAALADEAAQQVLSSGVMTRALAYSGFGEVDLAESAATTSTGVVLTSLRGGRTAAQPRGDDPDGGDATGVDVNASDGADDGDADDGAGDGAEALAEAAAEAEHERRVAQADQAVQLATREVGRRRAAVEAARNRTEATRVRVRTLEERLTDLQTQLETARDEDRESLEALTTAVHAASRAEQDLEDAAQNLRGIEE